MSDQQKLKKATYHLYTFLTSKMIGSLGMNVYAFGISMFILSMTGSSFSFSMNILCSILPRTLIAPLAGILGDRMPRKLLVIGGQAGIVLTVAALLFYTKTYDLNVYAIYIATIFNSIFGTFSGIAFSSSIANLVDDARLQRAMSFNQMAVSISGIGGPIVGGLMFGLVSMNVFLIVYLVSQTIALFLEATMNFNLYKKVKEEKIEEDNKESMVASFKAGLQYIKTKPLLIALLTTSFGLNFFFTSLTVGHDFVLITTLKVDSTYVGIIEAVSGVGVLLASIYFASAKAVKNPLQLSKVSIIIMSVMVMLAALPLVISLSHMGNFLYFATLMFFFGVLNMATNMPIGVLFQKTIDDEYRSRVFSILEMVALSLMPLAMLVYGILFDIVKAEYLFVGSGLILIIITLVTLRPSIVTIAKEVAKEVEEQNTEEVSESAVPTSAN